MRNYTYEEWVAIELGKPGTKKTRVKLASEKWYDAGMTSNGEFMMYPRQEEGEAPAKVVKGHWICPVNRCRKELGLNLIWCEDGCFLCGGNLPAPISAKIINDLPYITVGQFEDVRRALAASHRNGRRRQEGRNRNPQTNAYWNYDHATTWQDWQDNDYQIVNPSQDDKVQEDIPERVDDCTI